MYAIEIKRPGKPAYYADKMASSGLNALHTTRNSALWHADIINAGSIMAGGDRIAKVKKIDTLDLVK
jgi:hypothetical protein